jgi:hypothetical protein
MLRSELIVYGGRQTNKKTYNNIAGKSYGEK